MQSWLPNTCIGAQPQQWSRKGTTEGEEGRGEETGRGLGPIMSTHSYYARARCLEK